MIKYEDEIRHIFMAYINENYWYIKRKRRLMLTYPEVMLQNKRWSYISIVLFLKESETSPHLASVEHCEEIMRGLVPPGIKQMEFYNRHILSDAYHKDVNGYPHPYTALKAGPTSPATPDSCYSSSNSSLCASPGTPSLATSNAIRSVRC